MKCMIVWEGQLDLATTPDNTIILKWFYVKIIQYIWKWYKINAITALCKWGWTNGIPVPTSSDQQVWIQFIEGIIEIIFLAQSIY